MIIVLPTINDNMPFLPDFPTTPLQRCVCGKYEIYSFMMTAECATANAFYGFWVQVSFTSQHSQPAEATN